MLGPCPLSPQFDVVDNGSYLSDLGMEAPFPGPLGTAGTCALGNQERRDPHSSFCRGRRPWPWSAHPCCPLKGHGSALAPEAPCLDCASVCQHLCASICHILPHRETFQRPLHWVRSHGGETLLTASPWTSGAPTAPGEVSQAGSQIRWGFRKLGALPPGPGASRTPTPSYASKGEAAGRACGVTEPGLSCQPGPSGSCGPGPAWLSSGLKACLLRRCCWSQTPTGFGRDRRQGRVLRMAGTRAPIVPGESGLPCPDFQAALS